MSGGYDRALTIFSPDGYLLQVEYAAEAVRKGMCVVGVRSENSIVIAAECRTAPKLQDTRSARKIVNVDDRIALAFSGLQADTRVLIEMARVEAQSYRLNMELPPSVEYIGRYIASVKQKYTIQGGRRPFGVSALIAGFSHDGSPGLYQTEPHGILTSWKAQAIGRNAKTLQDFLEKNVSEDLSDSKAKIIAIRALLEVVETSQQGNQNIDVVVVTRQGILRLSDQEVNEITMSLEFSKASDMNAQDTSAIA